MFSEQFKIMVLQLLFGLALLIIVIYISLKIFQNIVFGIILVILVLFASYLIIGSVPSWKDIPLIGGFLQNIVEKYFPKLHFTGEAIGIKKDMLYSLEILSVERDYEGNVIVVIANTGRENISGIKVFVDGEEAKILNKPKDPLVSKEVTAIQIDFKGNFSTIVVKGLETSAAYP